MRNRPNTNTRAGQPSREPETPNWTGVAPVRTMPALTRPMRETKRPRPTVIAVFRAAGTARKTASRKPVRTSRRMSRPSHAMTPMASL